MSTAVAELPVAKTPNPPRKPGRKIPDYLVREVIDGIPFYYAGYRSVLNKTKKLDDIMPDSELQWILKDAIGDALKAEIDKKSFKVLVGEGGSHVDRRNNLSLDVAIFDKNVLTPDKITNKYIDVPPHTVIEVDVNVELPDRSTDMYENFVMPKVRRLFAFGTKKIIWVFSKSKSVIVATPDAPWQIFDWHHDIELFPGIIFNIEKYLKEEGISSMDVE
jgi:hypothetical protein